MPDISQMTSDLRGLPDQALQHELTQPSGIVPSYLVLAEAQRRQLMRSAAQKQQSQGQSGTVMDDVVRNMMAGQPSQDGPPPPAGMTPPKTGQGPPQQGPPGMPGAAPPQQMQGLASGGAIRFADGDLVEDDGEEDGPQVSAQGSADRAMQPVNVDDLAEAMVQFEGSRKPTSPGFHANNPGHLKYAGQKGSIGQDPLGFARFNDWNTGLDAMKNQIRLNLKRGLSLNEMIGGKPGVYPGWAPASDHNNTSNYINYLQKQTNYDPNALMQEGDTKAAPAKTPVLAASQADQGPATGPSQGSADTPTEKPVPPAAVEQPAADPEEEEGDGEADRTTEAAPAKPASPSYVMPGAREFDPYNPANIDKQRQLYYTIFGGSPERQQQLEAQRAATVAQLQGLQQDSINRYRNPSPWEFLANIGAGMGASKQLSLPLMFAQGVGQAWQARDQQQDQALTQAEKLQQHIDAIQGVGGTERERMGRDLVTLLGQQAKTPGGAAKFEDFVKMPGATYGSMDPNQVPPGKIGVPDPGHPGFGVWIDQSQATQAAKPLTGNTFEKDFLPGWAEENGTTTDKMTGVQRKQALKDFRAAQVDPSIKDAAQEIAQGIMEGTMPPDMKGLYKYGGQVRAILHQNGYNLATSALDWQNLSKFYAAQNGTQQLKMRQATEQVSETLPNLRKLYQDWQATGLPGGFKMFNRAALTAAANLPGQQGATAQRLLTQIHDLTFELGNMYTGGNATTDKALQLAGQNLNADWNPETFEAALKQLETNVKIRRNSMRNVAPVGVSPGGMQTYGAKPDAGADNTPPPRPAGIPPSAAAQWNPTRKQWRYKKPGSDTWEILPPQ